MIGLGGYGHVWGDVSIDGRGYIYGRGAFGRWLAQCGGVRLLYDHLDHLHLAGLADGSLELWEDSVGLAFRALVESRAMPLIDRDIRAGRVGCSLGGVRHLRREGDLVNEATFHEITLAPGGGAFPSARVWFEDDADHELTAHVRALQPSWRARTPVARPVGRQAALPTGPDGSPHDTARPPSGRTTPPGSQPRAAGRAWVYGRLSGSGTDNVAAVSVAIAKPVDAQLRKDLGPEVRPLWAAERTCHGQASDRPVVTPSRL